MVSGERGGWDVLHPGGTHREMSRRVAAMLTVVRDAQSATERILPREPLSVERFTPKFSR
jgi:hypothetical protein